MAPETEYKYQILTIYLGSRIVFLLLLFYFDSGFFCKLQSLYLVTMHVVLKRKVSDNSVKKTSHAKVNYGSTK